MRLLTALCLASAVAAAQTPSASYYPRRLDDSRAVYLERPAFAVHADGKGDDSGELQRAIDRVQETTRAGVVFVPSGSYRIGKTVNLWRGIRLIGFGPHRPVFVLAENTPGFDSGAGKYMIHFRDARPAPGQPLGDARNTTFYSGISNIDIEIRDGNPAAVAIRFHVAQLSSLEHMDFRIGSARGAVEAIGNEIEDCRFFGGEFAILTGPTSPGWQALVLDCLFEGQRRTAIETRDAGLTAIRNRFRNAPHAMVVTERGDEKLFVKDSHLERVSQVGIQVSNYFDPRTQINLENVRCAEVPVFLAFREVGTPPSKVPDELRQFPAQSAAYIVRRFSHGLHHENFGTKEVSRRLRTLIDRAPLDSLGELPPRDFPELPERSSWVNIAELGAKGDGKTDDTPVFKRAIAKHKAIYVPIGQYRLTDTLALKSDTVLIGLNPMATQLLLLSSTPGFTDAERPKPVVETARGGTNVFTGIGVESNYNRGAIAIRWTAGASSYLDDVLIPWGDRAAPKGNGQQYGLWVTDGGGGTFKNMWFPNSLAQDGFRVTDTRTEGRVYLASVEHHVDTEVTMRNAENWTWYALQTEENLGSEKSMAIDLERCRNVSFVNLFTYRIRASAFPHPFAIRLRNGAGISFRGVHNFSGGPMPFDTTLFDPDKGISVLEKELTWLTVH